jgi:asparagine synthetase B (glutamine-hydrolysing)
MPGISFIYDRKGRLRADHPEFACSKDPVFHDLQYRQRVLLQNDFHHLSCTAYPEYPVESIEDTDWTVHFEGRLYGEDPERKLRELAAYVLKDEPEPEEKIAEWLSSVDGNFVAFFLDKRTGQISILNDLFGRLPLYCCRTGQKFILSRDLRFIANLMDPIRFDRMALAQSLWIGYLLGKRTLLENVDRLPRRRGYGLRKSLRRFRSRASMLLISS